MNTSKNENTNNNTNIVYATIHAILSVIINSITSTSTYQYIENLRILVMLRQIKSYVLLHAYNVWSNRGLLFASHQTYIRRSGLTDIRMVVYIIIGFLISAILFPIAMAQVTAATTTSWGAGVAPIFVSLLPILVIIAIALHFFGAF